MTQPDIRVHDIDHLGIVAGVIDELGLVERINQRLGQHPYEIVSAGQVVKAMLLNGLGFVSAPLYLFEQFFVGKATEHLLGEGVLPEHLNDDRLGRVLDQLYEVGLTSLFMEIGVAAAQQYQVSLDSVHLDSSSFSVEGQYEHSKEDLEAAIHICHGYSRDQRPDLKQFMMNMMCSGDGGIPLYLGVSDGNQSDKVVFGQIITQFQQQWQWESLFVADAALYSAENLQQLRSIQWLTRVPASLKEAHQILTTLNAEELVDSEIDGYRIASHHSDYGGLAQRWLVVESESRQQSDIKQLDKQIEQEYLAAQKQLKQLSKDRFHCPEDADKALQTLAASWRYHQLEGVQIEAKAVRKRGRPASGSHPQSWTYHVQANLVREEAAISLHQQRAGRFILATNVLDQSEWSDSALLQEYKQQQTVERGFRFLKDPLFFTSSVFLKTEQRIASLGLIMGLCLLVYSLSQRQLRQALQQAQASVNSQLKRPTQTPTMRWIFQCFQSVHLVVVQQVKQVVNLTDERQWILSFLGPTCRQYYLLT